LTAGKFYPSQQLIRGSKHNKHYQVAVDKAEKHPKTSVLALLVQC